MAKGESSVGDGNEHCGHFEPGSTSGECYLLPNAVRSAGPHNLVVPTATNIVLVSSQYYNCRYLSLQYKNVN